MSEELSGWQAHFHSIPAVCPDCGRLIRAYLDADDYRAAVAAGRAKPLPGAPEHYTGVVLWGCGSGHIYGPEGHRGWRSDICKRLEAQARGNLPETSEDMKLAGLLEGECRQCGGCCQNAEWLQVVACPELVEWLCTRGAKVEVADDPQFVMVGIPHRCAQLREGPDGKLECAVHEAKPRICRQYPFPGQQLEPGCGFRWVTPEPTQEGQPNVPAD